MPHIRHDWYLRSRIRPQHMRLLAVLAEKGSLRHAAAAVKMTQSAATKFIQNVEEELGVKLFERSKRGMKPNVFGTAMIRHAQVFLSDLDRAHSEIAALASGASGQIRVGILASLSPILVASAIATLQRQRPGLQAAIITGSQDQLIESLQRGDLDLLIGQPLGLPPGGDLIAEVVGPEIFSLVCRAGHELASAERVSLADLARQAWVFPISDSPVRAQIDALFAGKDLPAPTTVVEASSTLMQILLVQHSDMIGMIAADAAAHFARSGMLKVLGMPMSGVHGWLGGMFNRVVVITRSERPQSPSLLAFLDALRTSRPPVSRRKPAA